MSAGVLHIDYTCEECGLEKVEIPVRARRIGEDVVAWVNDAVTPAISASHAGRSPDCDAKTITQVRIPIAGSKVIGRPPEN